MFAVAVRMCRGRLGALLAVACAVLGGAALLTGTGVLAETGLRAHLPAGRLAGATVLVSAPQQLSQHQEPSVALPERATVPAALTDRLRALPGVTAAAGDVSFPAAVLAHDGHPITAGDPATAGHGWSSTLLLPDPHISGTAPVGTRAAPDGGSREANGSAPDSQSPDGGASASGAGSPAAGSAGAAVVGQVGLAAGIAKAAGVRVGDRAPVVAAGKVGTYLVTAVVDAAGAGVLFDDATARALAGRDSGPRRGTVDLVGLRTAPGQAAAVAARIRSMAARGELSVPPGGAASGSAPADSGADSGAGSSTGNGAGDGVRLVVSTGAARGDVVLPGAVAARSMLVPLAGSMGGVVLMIVGFIVAGALGVAVAGQRRELALLRAVGATPRQVRRLAAAQATAVGLVVLVPGVLLGVLLAVRMRGLLVGLGVLPAGLPLSVGPLPAVGAAVLLLGVVQVAARAAAWRTSRLPATEAVAESRSEPRAPSRLRTRIGLLLLGLAVGASVVPLVIRSLAGAAATSMAGIVAAVGLALAGPALVRAVSGGLARLLPARVSAATWLAVANSRAYALRVAGAVSTLAMVVVFTLTYALTQTTVLAAGSGELAAGTHAQAVLTAPAVGGVPGDLLAAARAVPGVRAAAPVGGTTVLWPSREDGHAMLTSEPALVLTPDARRLLDPDVRAGSLADLSGGTVAVSSDTALLQGVSLGDRVRLVLGDGTPATVRVVAVYDRGFGFGPVVASRDLVAGHAGTGLDPAVLLRTDGSAATGRALTALAAAHPGVTLGGGGGQAMSGGATGLGGVPPNLWINLAVLAVLLGYLLLGVANKLVASTGQRRTEFAALRLIGTTPGQIRAMVRREAAFVVGTALVTGLLVSAVPLGLLAAGFLHRPWPAGPAWLVPAVAVVVAVIGLLAADLPTRRALRTRPTTVLADRG